MYVTYISMDMYSDKVELKMAFTMLVYLPIQLCVYRVFLISVLLFCIEKTCML